MGIMADKFIFDDTEPDYGRELVLIKNWNFNSMSIPEDMLHGIMHLSFHISPAV